MADILLGLSSRFQGDFKVSFAPHYSNPTQIEQEFLNVIAESLTFLFEEYTEDVKKERDGASVAADLLFLLGRSAKSLQDHVEKVAALPAGADRNKLCAEGVRLAQFTLGAAAERRRSIRRRPFDVSAVYLDPASTSSPIIDVKITTRDVDITKEQSTFRVSVDETRRVFRVVLYDRAITPERPLDKLRAAIGVTVDNDRRSTALLRRLNEYMAALVSLTQVGLMNVNSTQAPFATLALKGLQAEFVDREAAAIKNAYIERLGIWCAAIALFGLFGFFGSQFTDHDGVIFRFRRFFLLVVGAAIGTWLSFSLRRVVLKFEDLAALEDDRLSPRVRVFFVMFLTIVVGLLFWTKAITIELGSFSSDFRLNGAYAVLVGALCGIAERSLATTVMKRADDFASGIGRQS